MLSLEINHPPDFRKILATHRRYTKNLAMPSCKAEFRHNLKKEKSVIGFSLSRQRLTLNYRLIRKLEETEKANFLK
jgi:hypothetical protein